MRVLFLLFLLSPTLAARGIAQVPVAASGTSSLCSLLETIERGEPIPAVVSGIYYVGYEFQVLYDPDQPECEFDVQPSTWVEFSSELKDPTQFAHILENSTRTYVTFKGTLVGPGGISGPDDSAVSWMVSYARRVGHRYGHLNTFRTKFVVDAVVEARPVPESVPWAKEIFREESPTLPEVKSAEVPRYPLMARRADISGEVEIEVNVKDGAVIGTKLRSGDRVLAMGAEENIRTWKFAPYVTSTFTTRFVYSLEKPPLKSNRQPKVDLDLPSLVKITASYYEW